MKHFCSAVLATAILGVATLTSCGGKKEAQGEVFVPANTEVEGFLAGIFTVKDQNYVMDKNDAGEHVIDVQLERTSEMLPFPKMKFDKKVATDSGSSIKVDFGAVFVSRETGDTLLVIEPGKGGNGVFTNVDDVDKLLSKGGKSGRLRLHVPAGLESSTFTITSEKLEVAF